MMTVMRAVTVTRAVTRTRDVGRIAAHRAGADKDAGADEGVDADAAAETVSNGVTEGSSPNPVLLSGYHNTYHTVCCAFAQPCRSTTRSR